MTRRERDILKASVSWTDKTLTVNEEKAFQAGAKWADENPNWRDASREFPPKIEGRMYSKDVIILVHWGDCPEHVTTMHFGCYDYSTNEWHSSDGTVRKVKYWIDIKKPGEK